MHLWRTVHLGAKFKLRNVQFWWRRKWQWSTVNYKVEEQINDDSVETNAENKNRTMEYPIEEIPPKKQNSQLQMEKKPPPDFHVTFKGKEFLLLSKSADEMHHSITLKFFRWMTLIYF